ncbi:hypothetical protein [Streptomyces varsoviensis]|uniref:Uncharacterized protein n=1 Tax=Streptomyces varsoviensis TaxID=67373 RepID=A0ABR5IUW7_9ACTN|nr:hypothetical protein [Streptomyces varsoviensis]KOG78526.1 hypothetical protein ADK38_39355 [Streptomyces varsoviensis]
MPVPDEFEVLDAGPEFNSPSVPRADPYVPEATDLVHDERTDRDAIVVTPPGTYALDEVYLRRASGEGPGWGAKVGDLQLIQRHAGAGLR